MAKSLFPFISCFFCLYLNAQKIEISGPTGSGSFGERITVLPNGNFVVVDPYFDDGAKINTGAVYLYNGADYSLISMLKGNSNNDLIGLDGIKVLPNGNYLIISSYFNDGANTYAGAVTWCNGSTGVSGVVNQTNSLIGNALSNRLGMDSIKILPSGNYLVCSRGTANGSATSVGSVTWANQSTGISGVVSSSNSLVGSTTNDLIGNGGTNVTVLSNSNYVVGSSIWDNGTIIDAGAATWCSGATGLTGLVSITNSLTGSQASDGVGESIAALTNGNYVVGSREWDNGSVANVGASTWCNGTTGRTGAVTALNSLTGTNLDDRVGGATPLPNGNYIVISQDWNNGATADVGAVTFGNGITGITGVITTSNSLVGNATNTNFEYITYEMLTNGNYVIKNPFGWGSVTWGSGNTGVTGIVSGSNSLVGSAATGEVGILVQPLPNGNYAVVSRYNNGANINVGAVTWCSGTGGTAGFVSSANSLVGVSANDNVGAVVKVLSNSNYFVGSPSFDNGSIINAGAVTLCNGSIGTVGNVGITNSLVGSTANDNVGDGLSTSASFEIPNGKFILWSQQWDNGAIPNAGVLTMLDISTPIVGVINATNSLVGTIANKPVYMFHYINSSKAFIAAPQWDNGAISYAGALKMVDISTGLTGTFTASPADALLGKTAFDFNSYRIEPLNNGNYLLQLPGYTNSGLAYAGAVSFLNPNSPTIGEISSTNSYVGNSANEGSYIAIKKLLSGDYIITSPYADNGSITDAGGVMFCNGATGATGTMSPGNALMGTHVNDMVGYAGTTVLTNQRVYITSTEWDNGNNINAGALTFVKPGETITGSITHCNSLIGNPSAPPVYNIYNQVYDYLIALLYTSNKIVIYFDNNRTLATQADESSVNVTSNIPYDFIANTGCRILASIARNGSNEVSGTVNAKVWAESSVPVYAGQPFVSRHYEITPVNDAPTATGRVTLYFTQQEFTDFNNHASSILNLPDNPTDAIGKANLRIGKYSGISNDNTGLPGSYTGTKSVIDPEDNDIIWNSTLNRWEVSFDVTGFSGFIVQTYEFVLPLRFLSFTAEKCNNNQVCLNWKTADEQNVSHFEIERSTDGRNFISLKIESAKNQPLNLYSATDDIGTLQSADIIFYRIKQVDADGKAAYSATAMVRQKNIDVDVFPTVFSKSFTLQCNLADNMQLQVYSAEGRLLHQQAIQQGINIINPKSDYKGVLIYKLINNEKLLATGKLISQ